MKLNMFQHKLKCLKTRKYLNFNNQESSRKFWSEINKKRKSNTYCERREREREDRRGERWDCKGNGEKLRIALIYLSLNITNKKFHW